MLFGYLLFLIWGLETFNARGFCEVKMWATWAKTLESTSSRRCFRPGRGVSIQLLGVGNRPDKSGQNIEEIVISTR